MFMVAHWNHFWQSYVFSDLVVMGNMIRATIFVPISLLEEHG
jgi:hypothetical protein